MSSPLKIVFFGTPGFAVASLENLIKHGCDVLAVVTAPDKPSGRGKKIRFSPVKVYSLEKGIACLQPGNLKDAGFLAALKNLKADLFIVVAFRMLPDAVWMMHPKGTFNLHASLLPQYRGAATINWAIINGERKTGVTTFFIRHDIDTGNIILQEEVPIHPDMNAGELHDVLMRVGAELVYKSVCLIAGGNPATREQLSPGDKTILKIAPKLDKMNTRLDIHKTAEEIVNHIRGLSPVPGLSAEFLNPEAGISLSVKIFKAKFQKENHHKVPGFIESDNKTFIKVYFLKGVVYPEELQLAGRNTVNVKDFLNGFAFQGTWYLKG
ncbi:MAG: methionyl-tRNA formyltransferase [Bacteroidia bacterium]|nr:methionyl-tRNA formyltransferase [Bacteroidia bacterium]